MHLDGQHFACIQELQQEWKPAEPWSQTAQHLHRMLTHQFSDRLPFQRSVRNPARMVIAVAQYPRFPDRAVAWQRCCEQVRQTAAAPEAVLIDRFEPQRIQRCLTHTLRYWPLA